VPERTPPDLNARAIDPIDHVAVDGADGIGVGHEHFPFDDAHWDVHLGQRHVHLAFLCERRPGVQVHERHHVGSARRKPGRNSGTRVPSRPSTGFAASPATFTETIDAPAGNVTFRNGCARFWTVRDTSLLSHFDDHAFRGIRTPTIPVRGSGALQSRSRRTSQSVPRRGLQSYTLQTHETRQHVFRRFSRRGIPRLAVFALVASVTH
jgi:hypothetical protein